MSLNHSRWWSLNGLPCQPTGVKSVLALAWICQNGQQVPALQDEKWFRSWGQWARDIVAFCSHFFGASLASGKQVLKDTGNLQVEFDQLLRCNFQPKLVVQDKQIITAIRFCHQGARKVIPKFRLGRKHGQLLRQRLFWRIFPLSGPRAFDQVKQKYRKQPLKIYMKIIERNKSVRNFETRGLHRTCDCQKNGFSRT